MPLGDREIDAQEFEAEEQPIHAAQE